MSITAEAPPPPTSASSDPLDIVLARVVSAMRPGWILLRDCVLAGRHAEAASRIRYVLLHPQVGIVLLDVLPAPRTPNAVDRMRRMLHASGFVVEFGDCPPILHLHLPAEGLTDLGQRLAWLFGQQLPLALRGNTAWPGAVRQLLTAPAIRPAGSATAKPPASQTMPPLPSASPAAPPAARKGRQ